MDRRESKTDICNNNNNKMPDNPNQTRKFPVVRYENNQLILWIPIGRRAWCYVYLGNEWNKEKLRYVSN